MKQLIGFQELPDAVLSQIQTVTDIWKRHLGDELTGVYLHGSIALNAFCPSSGDIDILAVVKNDIGIPVKLELSLIHI